MKKNIIEILELVLIVTSIFLFIGAITHFTKDHFINVTDPRQMQEDVARDTGYIAGMVSVIGFQLGVFGLLYKLKSKEYKQKTPE